MKLTFLGTSAGSIPIGYRQQASMIVESGCGVYWFDTGENCTLGAYSAKIDLLSTRAIFLSHMAMDHIAGLPRLLWSIRKLNKLAGGNSLPNSRIKVFVPCIYAWEGIVEMLEATTDNHFANDFIMLSTKFSDGVVLKNEDLIVWAHHNGHMGQPTMSHGWRSYGFRICNNGKSIVYTGDVENLSETADLLDQHTDLLVVDAAHNSISEIKAFIDANGFNIGRIALTHLGQNIQQDMEAARKELASALGDKSFIPGDGDSIEI